MKRLLFATLLLCSGAQAQFAGVERSAPSSVTSGNEFGRFSWPAESEGPVENRYKIYADTSSAWPQDAFPAVLNGAVSIRTKTTDAATEGGSTVVSFTLDQVSDICVGHDDAESSKPTWLTNDYTDTEFNAVTTSTTYSIYCDEDVAAGTVNLGGNCPTGGCGAARSMYFAFVAPGWRQVAFTATQVDTEAPTTPGNVGGIEGDTEVTLTWDFSTDNVGVTGYEVYYGEGDEAGARDTGPSLETTVSAATDSYKKTGLTNSTEHYMYVLATDAAGNDSAATADVFMTPESAGAPPGGADPDFSWDFSSESVGGVADVSGEWNDSVDGFSPYTLLRVESSDPLVAGSGNYIQHTVEKNGGSHSRSERRWSALNGYLFTNNDGAALSVRNYWRTDYIWYAYNYRVDEADSTILAHAPQFHDIGCCSSPPLSMQVSSNGFRMRLEDVEDEGGNNFATGFFIDSGFVGTTYKVVWGVKWDTRSDAEGGDGEVLLYIDSCSSPVASYSGANTHSGDATDGRVPFFKEGIYISGFKSGGTEGHVVQISYDNFAAGADKSCADALAWLD